MYEVFVCLNALNESNHLFLFVGTIKFQLVKHFLLRTQKMELQNMVTYYVIYCTYLLYTI